MEKLVLDFQTFKKINEGKFNEEELEYGHQYEKQYAGNQFDIQVDQFNIRVEYEPAKWPSRLRGRTDFYFYLKTDNGDVPLDGDEITFKAGDNLKDLVTTRVKRYVTRNKRKIDRYIEFLKDDFIDFYSFEE